MISIVGMAQITAQHLLIMTDYGIYNQYVARKCDVRLKE